MAVGSCLDLMILIPLALTLKGLIDYYFKMSIDPHRYVQVLEKPHLIADKCPKAATCTASA